MPWVIENLTGTVNSSNTIFTISQTPVTGTLSVFFPFTYCAEVVSSPDTMEYTRSGTTITFGLAPLTGSQPWCRYFY